MDELDRSPAHRLDAWSQVIAAAAAAVGLAVASPQAKYDHASWPSSRPA